MTVRPLVDSVLNRLFEPRQQNQPSRLNQTSRLLQPTPRIQPSLPIQAQPADVSHAG